MHIQQSKFSNRGKLMNASRAIGLLTAGLLVFVSALPADAQTLDRIRQSQRISLGYIADAAPFTSRGSGNTPEGYGIAVCQRVAAAVGAAVGRPDLAINWVAVTTANAMGQVQQGNIDLLCTPASETLSRRSQVSFSQPVFAGGVRAFLSPNAPQALREALSERPAVRPVWRGSPAVRTLQGASFGVVSNTTTESWLSDRLQSFHVDASIAASPNYASALAALQAGEVDVLFGELSLVLGALGDNSGDDITVIARLFTHEKFGLALSRGDEDFRLLVDRALSELYASIEFGDLYSSWLGGFDALVETFFMWNTIAE